MQSVDEQKRRYETIENEMSQLRREKDEISNNHREAIREINDLKSDLNFGSNEKTMATGALEKLRLELSMTKEELRESQNAKLSAEKLLRSIRLDLVMIFSNIL